MGSPTSPTYASRSTNGCTRPDAALRPVAIAGPAQINVVYVHATGMQQTWFFAPFQSHNMVTRRPEE